MPLIYTARCSTCGERFSASECDLAVQLDDGELVPLRHPGETWDLERAGFKWERAYDEARIVRCYNFVCKRCGGIYVRRMCEGPMACLTGLVAGLTCVLAFAAFMSLLLTAIQYRDKWHHPLIYISATVIVGGVAWFMYRRGRRSFDANRPHRPALADVRCCDASTPNDLVSLNEAERQRFVCSKCGKTSVTIVADGIS